MLVQVGDLIDGRPLGASEVALGALRDRLGALEAGGVAARAAASSLREALFAAEAGVDEVAPHGSTPARQALFGALASWRCLRGLVGLRAEARRAGGCVVVLRGNHEQDLLSGVFRWHGAQKELLLALEGVSPAQVSSLRTCSPGPAKQALWRRWAGRSHALRFVAELPVLLRVGPLLITHGGPCSSLLRWLDGVGDPTWASVVQALGEAYAVGPDHPLWAEGDSLLSPDRPDDDPVAHPDLALDLLRRADARVLAVGHSPFVGLPRSGWWDVQDQRVSAHLRQVQRLGPDGRLIKLDADLKRQPDGGAVTVLDAPAGKLGWLDQTGHWTDLLLPGETLGPNCEGLAMGPIGRDGMEPSPCPQGVDALAVTELFAVLDLAGAQEPPVPAALLERLRAATALLLQAEAAHLGDVVLHLRAWLSGDAAALRRTLDHVAAIDARIDRLAEQALERGRCATVVAFAVASAERSVRGRHYRLEGPVLQRTARLASSRGLERLIVCLRGAAGGVGQAVIRLGARWPSPAGADEEPLWLELPTPAESADAAQLAAEAMGAALRRDGLEALGGLASTRVRALAGLRPAGSEGGAAERPAGAPTSAVATRSKPGQLASPLAEACGELLRLNATALAQGSRRLVRPRLGAALPHVDVDGQRRDLIRLELQGEREPVWAVRLCPVLPLETAPGGHLLLVNEAFLGLDRKWSALPLDEGGQPLSGQACSVHELLLGHMPAGSLRLYASLRPQVERILRAGDWDALGHRAERARAPWDDGPRLFVTPSRAAAACFHEGRRVHCFRLECATVRRWVRQGWAHLGLMLLLQARLQPPLWGSQHLAPELAMLAAEGVAALWATREAAGP